MIHPDDRDRVWKTVQCALERRVLYETTYRLLSLDGREVWVTDKGQGIWSPDGTTLEALEGVLAHEGTQLQANEAPGTVHPSP